MFKQIFKRIKKFHFLLSLILSINKILNDHLFASATEIDRYGEEIIKIHMDILESVPTQYRRLFV